MNDYFDLWEDYGVKELTVEEKTFLDIISYEISRILNKNDEIIHIFALDQLINAFIFWKERY